MDRTSATLSGQCAKKGIFDSFLVSTCFLFEHHQRKQISEVFPQNPLRFVVDGGDFSAFGFLPSCPLNKRIFVSHQRRVEVRITP
jgi:hypothetical protein